MRRAMGHKHIGTPALYGDVSEDVLHLEDRRIQSPLLAQSGHTELHCTCPLSGVKRTLNRCSPISIYGYTTHPPGGDQNYLYERKPPTPVPLKIGFVLGLRPTSPERTRSRPISARRKPGHARVAGLVFGGRPACRYDIDDADSWSVQAFIGRAHFLGATW
jgi:hypothetical protein